MSRISKVVHGAATIVTQFIPDQTGMNQHLRPGQWEHNLRFEFQKFRILENLNFLPCH